MIDSHIPGLAPRHIRFAVGYACTCIWAVVLLSSAAFNAPQAPYTVATSMLPGLVACLSSIFLFKRFPSISGRTPFVMLAGALVCAGTFMCTHPAPAHIAALHVSGLILSGFFAITLIMAWFDTFTRLNPRAIIVLAGCVVSIAAFACWGILSCPREVASLIDRFNVMSRELSVTYEELEEQVEARTQDLRRANEELAAQRDNLEALSEKLAKESQVKSDLLSMVNHELRTPLTSIRGWVETLRTLDDPADENYRKGLEIINNETGRLYNMVEELLDFSRLQNGRIRMDCRPLDLVAELTDAVLFCEARIQREGLVLSYTEPEEMIPVYADPDRLRQVFINIMDNAIKYSAPGGRITVKLWAGEYKAFAEIIDQGRGIPPEDLENVKTKFYKGSNSVRGSGIGLALVDSIMTALDGTMDLKSTLGRGTVVTLGLPIYKR